MTIVNRRNAFVGWLALKAGKILARKQGKKLAQKLPFGRKSSAKGASKSSGKSTKR